MRPFLHFALVDRGRVACVCVWLVGWLVLRWGVCLRVCFRVCVSYLPKLWTHRLQDYSAMLYGNARAGEQRQQEDAPSLRAGAGRLPNTRAHGGHELGDGNFGHEHGDGSSTKAIAR